MTTKKSGYGATVARGSIRVRTEGALSRESARYRTERNAARKALAARDRLLREYQLNAVADRLAGRLLIEDFEEFIGLDKALDEGGRIDRWALEQHLNVLFEKRPGLALPAHGDNGSTGVKSEETG